MCREPGPPRSMCGLEIPNGEVATKHIVIYRSVGTLTLPQISTKSEVHFGPS